MLEKLLDKVNISQHEAQQNPECLLKQFRYYIAQNEFELYKMRYEVKYNG